MKFKNFFLLFLCLIGVVTFVLTLKSKDSTTQNTNERTREKEKEMTSLSEEVKSAPKVNRLNAKENLSKFLDKDSRDRIGPNIIARIPQVEGGDAVAVAKVMNDPTDNSTIRNEAANLLRRSKDPNLEQHLMKSLNNPEETEKFRAYSVQHLYLTAKKSDDYTKERITKVLIEKLDDPERMVRRESFKALTKLKHPLAKELVTKLMDSEKGKDMRDLVIRAARSLEVPEAVPSIRKYLDDSHGPVVVAAAYTLGEMNDKESLAKIIQVSENEELDSYIRKAAKVAVDKLRKESE